MMETLTNGPPIPEGDAADGGAAAAMACSICLEEDDRSNLVQPCRCRTMAVHPACLETWINTRPAASGPGASGVAER
jgi:E3 ubiquitin-protein ligase DOA10